MKTALRIVATLVLAVVAAIASAACAPQERMDAYVKVAHPGAQELGRFDSFGRPVGADDAFEVYALCEQNTIHLVFTNRMLSIAKIYRDVELDKNHVTCK